MMIFWTALVLISRPAPPPAVSALIAEARKVSRIAGEDIWPGFSRVPFAIDLVGERYEYLFCASGPAKGFAAQGRDTLTGCRVKVRLRKYRRSMRATFPDPEGIPRVVIGMPAHTDANHAAWIATLLHEHFHQMQMHTATYQHDVRALDLSRGDETGAWMLNYAFPYQRPDVARGFARAAAALARALKVEDNDGFGRKVQAWRAARRHAFSRLDAASARYGEFQLWQEGVARYSEIALAEAIAGRLRCRAKRGACPDYSALALNLRVRVMRHLEHFDLAKNGRISFYALGAGEALLLDRLNPRWREQYFQAGLSMAPLVYQKDAAAPAPPVPVPGFVPVSVRNGHERFSPSDRGGQKDHGRP